MMIVDTLESAKQAAEDSQYSSAPKTLGQGYRKRQSLRRFEML